MGLSTIKQTPRALKGFSGSLLHLYKQGGLTGIAYSLHVLSSAKPGSIQHHLYILFIEGHVQFAAVLTSG